MGVREARECVCAGVTGVCERQPTYGNGEVETEFVSFDGRIKFGTARHRTTTVDTIYVIEY